MCFPMINLNVIAYLNSAEKKTYTKQASVTIIILIRQLISNYLHYEKSLADNGARSLVPPGGRFKNT